MRKRKHSYRLLSIVLALLLLTGIPVQVMAETKAEFGTEPTQTREVSDEGDEEEILSEPQGEEEAETLQLRALSTDKLGKEDAEKADYETNYNLKELHFYVKDANGEYQEIDIKEGFAQDKYSYGWGVSGIPVVFPRGNREVRVVAIPMAADVEAKVSAEASFPRGGAQEAKVTLVEPHTFDITWAENEENYNNGFWVSFKIVGHPEAKIESGKYRYSIRGKVEGYPKPEIHGVKDLVFPRNAVVSKQEILSAITATDERDGDLTSKIEMRGWESDIEPGKQDFLLTRYKREYNITYKVMNSHNQFTRVEQKIYIVENEDEDHFPPVFHGLYSKTFALGEEVGREKLLDGVTAIDNVDGDITKRIVVSPEKLDTSVEGIETAVYEVTDNAGNKTREVITHYVKKGTPVRPNLDALVEKMSKRYYGTGDDWSAVDMTIYGKKNTIHKGTLLTKAQTVIAKKPKKVTEYQRIALSLTAAGFDVRNIPTRDGGTINLIETIANHQPMGSLNDYIWALIAYDSGKYTLPQNSKWTREYLVNYLLEHQLNDGSWNLQNKVSKNVDVDITAMAITALAPYQEDFRVAQALEGAVDLLGRIKTNSYCYIYGINEDGKGELAETSESSSQVLIALASMGIDPDTDPRFSNGKKSVLDGLYTFMAEDSTFKHVKVPSGGYSPIPNAMATEQAFRALSVYQKARSRDFAPYHAYTFANYGERPLDPVEPIDPVEPVEPLDPTEPIDPGEIVTLYDLRITQVPYKTTYNVGETPDLSGLEVEAIYSDGTRNTLRSDEVEIIGFDTSNWAPNRTVQVAYGGLYTSFSIIVESTGEHSGTTATISVVDPKGRTYYSPKELEINPNADTAFTLLQKTGLNITYNAHSQWEGYYVSAIEGLAEFDGGPDSGWMYRVNGTFPGYSSSLYKLSSGDRVEWLYTRDLGADLGAPMTDDKKEGEHYITIRHGAGGSTTPSGKNKVKEGESLTITMKPDTNYAVQDVKVDGKSVGAVNSYTFSNVKSDGTLDVTFVLKKDQEQKKEQQKSATGFTDIGNHWGKLAIEHGIAKKYFTGKSATIFAPDDKITRGEFVTVLGRRAGVSGGDNRRFTDVEQGLYYTPYVGWAVDNGIVNGYEDETFRPNQSITREEMAKMYYQYIIVQQELVPEEKDQTFIDEKTISSWAKDSVEALTKMKLVQGMGDGTFGPKKNLTRAEVAQLLYNLDQKK